MQTSSMYKIYFLFVCFAATYNGFSQQTTLSTFEQQRINYNKKGMALLGGWSAANIIVSAFAGKTGNQQTHYFHNMNVMWNSVNLALATVSYISASKETTNNLTLTNVLNHQNKTEKLFLFNAGLDVAYITGGFYLKEKGNSKVNPSKLKGYGNAVVVQGGFLLLFDAIMYAVHNKHGKALNTFTDKVQLAGSAAGVAMVYRF